MRTVGRKKISSIHPDQADVGSASFDLERYFNTALALVQGGNLLHRDTLTVAGYQVELITGSRDLQRKFVPSLAHLLNSSQASDSNAGDADLTIYYVENSSLARGLTAPPSGIFNAQGFADELDQDEIQIFYQPWVRQLFLYSQSLNIGIYWVFAADETPWWETTFSFRVIFHWWSRNKPLQLMHAGAMSNDSINAWLIPGPSGSGKSTSCLQLLLHGAYYLSDDYVLVGTAPPYKVYSLYQTAKINPDNFDQRFSDLKQKLNNAGDYQNQKAVLLIGEYYPDQLVTEALLQGILIPKIQAGSNSSVAPVNPAKAMMSIAPTTLFHLPHHREIAFSKITSIVSRFPVQQWFIGSEKDNLVASFQSLTSTV